MQKIYSVVFLFVAYFYLIRRNCAEYLDLYPVATSSIFLFPSVRPFFTGVTYKLPSIIWWFRPWKVICERFFKQIWSSSISAQTSNTTNLQNWQFLGAVQIVLANPSQCATLEPIAAQMHKVLKMIISDNQMINF